MQSVSDEKRQNNRLRLAVPLRYQLRGKQVFGNTITKNISTCGVSFVSDKFIKPQTYLALEFNLLSRNISSVATVRWAGVLPHSDKYQVGLEFAEIGSEDKNYLSDFIDMRFHKAI